MVLHYSELPRFQDTDHIFAKETLFGVETIFKVMTLFGEIRYLKVIERHFYCFFDLVECDSKGILLKNPYKNTASLREIRELIQENVWILYRIDGL